MTPLLSNKNISAGVSPSGRTDRLLDPAPLPPLNILPALNLTLIQSQALRLLP